MVISSKRNKPYHPPLQMNDQDFHVVNSHKHLGVIISDNGVHTVFGINSTKYWGVLL
jgi:hypothetical protein